jgi:Ca2+-transporting ATPase
MEFFIDVSATVAFEREGEEPGAMARRPRPRGQPLMTRPILIGIAIAGGFSALAALWLVLTIGGTPSHASWVAFTTLVVAQLVRANANRSLRQSLLNLAPNVLLLGMGLIWLATQAAIPYIPPLADAFQATPLSGVEWALVAIIALAPAVVAEAMRRTGRTWIA